ncbi:MAG: hypothetical protein QOJ89_676 [bacterium]
MATDDILEAPDHQMAAPFVLGPGDGPTVRTPIGGPLAYKLRGEQTDGTVTIFESAAPPGAGPPRHVHEHSEECIYVLEGDVRVSIGDEVRSAPAGAFAFIPRGCPHTWRNVGSGHARLLVVFSPAGIERFFDEFDALPAGAATETTFADLAPIADMKVI